MHIVTLDWIIIAAFFLVTMLIGLFTSRQSGKSNSEFFLGGRKMPWWLLGVSMVATTFSADTPNLVTDIVRKGGVAGNWAWWAFLLTGMLTVFVYAKLWRRSGITTDLEFYEIRYSGREATVLRAFRALYLGVLFNVFIMATVLLAGIKIGGILLGLSATEVVIYVSIVTVIYSAVGGFRGVILTDFFQFGLAMIGMIWAAVYIVNMPEIDGLHHLLSHPAVAGKLSFLPDFNDSETLVPLLLIPIAVQWWSVWYPGAEPGGGGYIAQRMLSAKDEQSAIKATLLFNLAHYALRPWPWIIIALASLVVFPEVSDIGLKFPNIEPSFVKDDLAFSAMLSYLPKGLLGLVIAALIAALMSTISTHLNWGSSYIVNDFYKRFLNKDASEKSLVAVGRFSTVVLMVLAAFLALYLKSAKQSFDIMLQVGAGTGLLFILRWFWWKINAMTEIVAMIVSFLVAVYFQMIYTGSMLAHEKLVIGVVVTSIAWLSTALLTRPTESGVLLNFFKMIKPHKMGWGPVISDGITKGELSANDLQTGSLSSEILMMFLGCVTVYSLLFGTGFLIYGSVYKSLSAVLVSALSSFAMWKLRRKI